MNIDLNFKQINVLKKCLNISEDRMVDLVHISINGNLSKAYKEDLLLDIDCIREMRALIMEKGDML